MCSAKILLAKIFNEIDIMSTPLQVWWGDAFPASCPRVRACL